MSIAKEANAACMQAALGKASIAEQAILDQVRSFFASDSWLEGATGADALADIENAEFEITRLLTEECGPLGPAFKQSADYENGKRYLNELREKHRAPASNEPATGVPVPTVQVVGAVANPLGFYDDLLSLINDQVVKDERSFKVIFSGLRGESNNSDDKGAWKAAGLGLYTRHKALNPEMELQPFDDLWSDSLDRRFDKRVISNYARMSDKQRYKALCLDKSIENWESKSAFSEMELRDYYIMAYGDNLIRIQDVEKGIGIWYRGRWYWDKRGRILQHEVFNVVHALYNDLLARHAQKKRDLPANEDSEEKKKEIDKLIARTIKSVENFGNQQNKNVVAIIQNQQIAQSLEVDPFDEEPLLFCFTNKVYNFKTNAFQPHFKFDYMLRNCGREWREPTNARVERVQELLESVQPDTDSRKSLLSVLRSCLTGIRPELFIILTGGGRNGKSLIVEWIQFLLATYGLEPQTMSSRQYSINHYQDDQYLSAEEGDDDYHTNPLGNDSRSGIDAERRCLPASAPPATKHQTERRAETKSQDVCTRNGNYEKEMTGKTLQRNDNFNKDNYQLNNYQLKTASSETMAYYRPATLMHRINSTTRLLM